MSNKNSEIKKAIDAFEIDKARSLLREALKEADAETYYLASLVAFDEEQKVAFLNKALEADPFHEKSHTSLKGTNNKVISRPDALEKPINSSSILSADINQFINSVVKSDSESIQMHVIPIDTGLVRTELRNGIKVILIERDERAEWLLCGYLSPIGQSVIGWLPFSKLKDSNFMNNEINLLDLPITRFEPYNTRAEVLKLIEEKKKKLKGFAEPTKGIVLSSIAAFMFICGGIFFTLGLEESFGLVGILIGVLFLFATIKAQEEIKSINESNAPFKEEIKRLELLQKDMRSEYEKLRDDQRFTMGIQAGLDTAKNLVGIAGNTVASKILTASNEPKDKKK